MSPKLVLYSDQMVPQTDRIDEQLFSILPRSGAKIGYLPSSPDPERFWFQKQQAYYARFGVTLISFGLESEFDPESLSKLAHCDAIHLSGGNTFQFLYWLRRREVFSVLRRYVNEGGVLVGVSAGAILMTPDVSTSYFCGDIPYPQLDDFAGLRLVEFSIVPHYEDSLELRTKLVQFSSKVEAPIFGVPDGSGIVVQGEVLQVIGPVWKICADGNVDLVET